MNQGTRSRGGAPVGFLSELPSLEAASVCFLRLWCESAATQKQAVQDLNSLLGAGHGAVAVDALRSICDLLSRHARRKMMRHQMGCSCLGADEACFANLVAEASFGQREDAMMFAMLIVRADFAPSLVGAAEQFGLALSTLERRSSSVTSAMREAEQATVH